MTPVLSYPHIHTIHKEKEKRKRKKKEKTLRLVLALILQENGLDNAVHFINNPAIIEALRLLGLSSPQSVDKVSMGHPKLFMVIPSIEPPLRSPTQFKPCPP
jgi:hypothetical protein